jgi:hypothetical protein
MGFEQLAQIFGIPTALVIFAILTNKMGVWVFSREVDREKEATERERQATKEAEERSAKKEIEIAFWRDRYLSGQAIVEKALTITEKQMGL